jgi:hypothetical protein
VAHNTDGTWQASKEASKQRSVSVRCVEREREEKKLVVLVAEKEFAAQLYSISQISPNLTAHQLLRPGDDASAAPSDDRNHNLTVLLTFGIFFSFTLLYLRSRALLLLPKDSPARRPAP